MTGTMPRKKKADAPPPKPVPISYRPTADVYAAFQAFRAGHEFPPSYTEVIDRALRMYLRAKGYKDLPEVSPES